MSVGKNNPQRRATRMVKREVKWAGTPWKEKIEAGDLSLEDCLVRSGPNSTDKQWLFPAETGENQSSARASGLKESKEGFFSPTL